MLRHTATRRPTSMVAAPAAATVGDEGKWGIGIAAGFSGYGSENPSLCVRSALGA